MGWLRRRSGAWGLRIGLGGASLGVGIVGVGILGVGALAGPAFAQDAPPPPDRLGQLLERLDSLLQKNEALERRLAAQADELAALRRRVEAHLPAPAAATAPAAPPPPAVRAPDAARGGEHVEFRRPKAEPDVVSAVPTERGVRELRDGPVRPDAAGQRLPVLHSPEAGRERGDVGVGSTLTLPLFGRAANRSGSAPSVPWARTALASVRVEDAAAASILEEEERAERLALIARTTEVLGSPPAYAPVLGTRPDVLFAEGHDLRSIRWEGEAQDERPQFALDFVDEAPALLHSRSADAAAVTTPVAPGEYVLFPIGSKLSVGGSNATKDELAKLGAGRANPGRKGLWMDAGSLKNQFDGGGLFGKIVAEYDPDPQTHLGDDKFRLREVYGALKTGDERLILRAGQLTIPYGLYGKTAWEDTWAWLDRPIAYGRMFGGDLSSAGASVAFRLFQRDDADAVLLGGVVDATSLPGFYQGTAFFGGHAGNAHSPHYFGDLAWFGRAEVAADLCRARRGLPFVVQGGFSFVAGGNGTGNDGKTVLYAAHARAFRMLSGGKRPSGFLAEAEWMGREVHVDASGKQHEDDLWDAGWWGSVLWVFPDGRGCSGPASWGQWSLGARWEDFTGSGGNEDADGAYVPRSKDPLRADRRRASFLVVWRPNEYCPVFLQHFAFTVQYAFDDWDHVADKDFHTVFLGFEVH